MLKITSTTKLILFFIYVIFILLSSSFEDYIILGLGLIIVLIFSNVNLKKLFRLVLYFGFFTFLMLIYNIFVIEGGEVVFTIFNFEIHSYALVFTSLIFIRVLLMVVASFITLSNLDSYEFAMSLEFLLSPLRVFKLNPSKIATTLMISIMFVPILSQEYQRITKAQAAKGNDVRGRNIFIILKNMMKLLVPLFLNSFQHADDLAIAMDVKGYDENNTRSHYYEIIFNSVDILSIILIFLYSCLIFVF